MWHAMPSPGVVLLALNLAAAVVLVSGIAIAAERLIRSSPLALRHRLLCLAVIVILASPLPTWLAGSWGLGLVTVSSSAPAHEAGRDSLAADGSAKRAEQVIASLPRREPASSRPADLVLPRTTAGDPTVLPASGHQPSEAVGPTSTNGMNSVRVAAAVLILGWAAVSLWLVLRLAQGIYVVARF